MSKIYCYFFRLLQSGHCVGAAMEAGARALDVLPLLQERVAALTGGRDRRGGPIIWFPANSRRDRVAPDDYRRLLHYLISIPWYVYLLIVML